MPVGPYLQRDVHMKPGTNMEYSPEGVQYLQFDWWGRQMRRKRPLREPPAQTLRM